ncbi:hypothetical protein ACW9KT_21835 [Hymenobacter sp. HD11105]
MDYRFWIWKHKLPAVLTMVALVAQASLSEEAVDDLRYRLGGTADGLTDWVDFTFPEASHVQLRLCLDEDDTDIVHLAIRAPADLYDRLQLIDAIQATFSLLQL